MRASLSESRAKRTGRKFRMFIQGSYASIESMELFVWWWRGCEGFSGWGRVLGRRGGEPPLALSTTLTILCRSSLSDILQLAAMVECCVSGCSQSHLYKKVLRTSAERERGLFQLPQEAPALLGLFDAPWGVWIPTQVLWELHSRNTCIHDTIHAAPWKNLLSLCENCT